jgi:formylglycine-generating enzyme required for sulfatase activity/proteasome lid subunit RPN8/RPN11
MSVNRERPGRLPGDDVVELSSSLLSSLLDYVTQRYPAKCFGYLAAPAGQSRPSEFFAFTENVRNSRRWKNEFESRGRYFVDHPDAGFVATEEESFAVQRQLLRRNLREVALFHTHRRHPGNFSDIDYELHVGRSAEIWHLIISLRNPRQPQVRAFAATGHGVRELKVVVPAADSPLLAEPCTELLTEPLTEPLIEAWAGPRPAAMRAWRAALELDAHRRPKCRDSAEIWRAVRGLAGDPESYREFVVDGFLADAEERYHDHVERDMVSLGGTTFEMGSAPEEVRHFCGETPRHEVRLSRFLLSRFTVTKGLYALFDRGVEPVAGERDLPAVNVSWFDAAVAALWFGCRLPTEAEWEFACGAGSAEQWCCPAQDLGEFAWYSENAGKIPHPVGTRKPNSWGLHDLHGNVWEWCQDDYLPDFYGVSPVVDPVATPTSAGTRLAPVPHKVSRGGGFLALTEMCRTRYRLHDPAGYRATDLGFRLARSDPADPAEPGG